jgi:hypothetical protein
VQPEPAAPQWNDESVGYDASVGFDDRGGRRSRWGRILILAVIALVLGTGLGLGGSWLLERLRGNPEDGDLGQHPVPEYTGTLPSSYGDPTLDPDLTPHVTLTDRQTSVQLTWTDPSDGRATFVIVDDATDKALSSVEQGHTTGIVSGLDPTKEYCFHILVLLLTENTSGISDSVCTDRG